MANFLISLGTLALILVSLFLIFVVLMQRANTNAGLGTAFGGGIAESTFGSDAGNILTRSTVIATVLFFVLSFGLYLGYIGKLKEAQTESGVLPDIEAENIVLPTGEASTAAEGEAAASEFAGEPLQTLPAAAPATETGEAGVPGASGAGPESLPVAETPLPPSNSVETEPGTPEKGAP